MKVKDLIEKINGLDGDAEVIVKGHCENCGSYMHEIIGAEAENVFKEETPDGFSQNYRYPKIEQNGDWTGEDDIDDAINAVVLY